MDNEPEFALKDIEKVFLTWRTPDDILRRFW